MTGVLWFVVAMAVLGTYGWEAMTTSRLGVLAVLILCLLCAQAMLSRATNNMGRGPRREW